MHEKRYETWLKNADDAIKKELLEMSEQQILDAFFRELQFGTAGLRGEMGVGTNRLNEYTVKKATKGVGDYLLSEGKRRVVVSYDCRLNSEALARVTAEVFAWQNLEVFITETLMPTPFLAYSVKALGADAGVVITASHNPKIYNGYKVYDGDGCQIGEEVARKITSFIQSADEFEIRHDTFEEYLAKGKIKFCPASLVECYEAEVLSLVPCRAEGIRVVYSALNGTGYQIVPRVLKKIGAEVVETPGQNYPDGNFETCPYPNPEKPEAWALAIKTAKEVDADIVIATDPDADRMGLAVKREEDYVLMSGNEVGAILTDYLLCKWYQKNGYGSANCLPNGEESQTSTAKATGDFYKKPIVIKSVVSTDLVRRIVDDYGGETREVLTGFKNIGAEMAKIEEQGRMNCFVLGFEESCGYLCGNYIKDKDGVLASALIASACAQAKKQGQSALDRLESLYERYGRYAHKTVSLKFGGAQGAKVMQEIMADLREQPFEEFCGYKVTATDYLERTDALKANLLDYRADKLRVIIRPSGTEPLIKAYITCAYDRATNDKFMREIVDFLTKRLSIDS